ncbi:MAG: hypothetical protein JWM11_4451 [Planctomycetaceae bacterium]|nr:hypothetical protein [Planctomycetaceae bacterium]
MAQSSVHLCIMAGADNRYKYLLDTVRLSQPFFAAIHIIDTGSTDETESLGQFRNVRHRRLHGWKDNWPLAYSQAVRDVPDQDWFLFLDSDERPSQLLLDHLANDLLQFDLEGINCAYLPGIMHLSGHPVECETTDLEALLKTWPATHEEFVSSPCWTKRILIKITPETYVKANGGHCGFFQANERGRYLPRFYNHYKSDREIAASTVLCSWNCLESHGVPAGCPEWQYHNELRESTGLMFAKDFLQLAQSGMLPAVWLEFWKTLEFSTYPALVEYWKFAFRFRFSTQIEPNYCGFACCRYRGEQL